MYEPIPGLTDGEPVNALEGMGYFCIDPETYTNGDPDVCSAMAGPVNFSVDLHRSSDGHLVEMQFTASSDFPLEQEVIDAFTAMVAQASPAADRDSVQRWLGERASACCAETYVEDRIGGLVVRISGDYRELRVDVAGPYRQFAGGCDFRMYTCD